MNIKHHSKTPTFDGVFLHTPSNVGVLHRIIFSHTPDEAKSGGLAKACVPGKNYSVPEKIESLKFFCVLYSDSVQGPGWIFAFLQGRGEMLFLSFKMLW